MLLARPRLFPHVGTKPGSLAAALFQTLLVDVRLPALLVIQAKFSPPLVRPKLPSHLAWWLHCLAAALMMITSTPYKYSASLSLS